MIISIKKSRIAAMLFILSVFATYSWLIVWTTKAVIEYIDKAPTMQEYELNKIHTKEKLLQLYQYEDISETGFRKAEKVYKVGNSSMLEDDKACSFKSFMDPSKKRWFMARYNSKIQPAWTKDATELDINVYEWWLTLQNSQGVDTEKYLQKLFEVGIPKSNPYLREDIREMKQCRKCAVVGNSGNSFDSGYGKIIDEHDFVIRMNKAPTASFEKDVGEKTTHRFMYPESALEKLPNGESFVLTPFKPMDLKWFLSAITTADVRTYADVPHKLICDVSKVIILSPAFIRYVHDRWTQHHGRYPSTGLLAVIYALHECDQVSLFGFGADKNGNWHHYWEDIPLKSKRTFKSTGVHDSEWESSILQQLQTQKIVQWYRNE